MRRWKIMFDRHGDILRCEQLDGPLTYDGEVLIVSEEASKPDWGPGSAPPAPSRPVVPSSGGGDSIEPEETDDVDATVKPPLVTA